MIEDMIDFPCSDDWLEHYNRIGLTPRKPIEDKKYHYLMQRIEKLEKNIETLLNLLREEKENTKFNRSNKHDDNNDKFIPLSDNNRVDILKE